MKVECKLEPTVVTRNRMVGILIVFIGILMALCYSLVLDYLEKTSKVDFKVWDLNTCTVADYSVELQLPDKVWFTYLDQKANGLESRPFDQYLLETFEQFVDGLPQRLDHHEGPVKIAAVSYGYYDGGLIKLLQLRGT